MVPIATGKFCEDGATVSVALVLSSMPRSDPGLIVIAASRNLRGDTASL